MSKNHQPCIVFGEEHLRKLREDGKPQIVFAVMQYSPEFKGYTVDGCKLVPGTPEMLVCREIITDEEYQAMKGGKQ